MPRAIIAGRAGPGPARVEERIDRTLRREGVCATALPEPRPGGFGEDRGGHHERA